MHTRTTICVGERTTPPDRTSRRQLVWIKLVAAGLLVAGTSVTGFSQSFQNLGFEEAQLVPVTPGYEGQVQTVPAFRWWHVYWDTNLAPFVLYNNMFLDSAGVSILDTNFYVLPQVFQGKYTALLYGGYSLTGYPYVRLPVSIAQTGAIPASAKTLLFDARMLSGGTDFAVSVAGQNLPYFALASNTNYVLYGVDVSTMAGQTRELRFTAYPHLYPEPTAINYVYLDDIRFSASPLTASPFILASPSSQTANAGSNVNLTVTATGLPSPAYQWFFNSTNVIAGAVGPALQLTNVNFAQSGAYTVVLTNIYGTVTSPPAILTVRDPFIINQPTSRTANAGQTASFSVTVGGTQPLGFQWLKDGAALHDGVTISGSASRALSLNGVSGADAGGYSVVISNIYSSVTSSVATLIVRDPVIVSQPVNQTINIGGTAVFNVVAGGTAPFTYQWFDAGVPLNDGGSISGSRTSSLEMSNTLEGEADAFWVVVSDSYGSVTSQVAFVSVTPPLYSVLHHFSMSGANPYSGNPYADLVQAGGILYGTAEESVFRINTDGTGFKIITDQLEGANGGLVLSESTLFGTTYSGENSPSPDYGRVFRVSVDGSGFAVLKSFSGGNDGGLVWAAPVLSGSTLYGATSTGGSSGQGTIFRVNTDGSDFTVLKDFTSGSDGGHPKAGLVLSGTTLYGTTSYNRSTGYYGTVFKLNTDGSGFVVLKQFRGSDGNQPRTSLALGGETLYGTTYYGGPSYPSAGSGTVFKVNTNGSGFAVLRYFSGGSDGKYPAGDLVLSGNTLYGTTSSGGISNYGTVFKLDIDGNNYSVLIRFRGNDGANPSGGLVVSRGVIYGTTSHGGIANNGVAFALSLSVPPSVDVNPAGQTAEVGSDVAFRLLTSGYQPTHQWIFNGTTFLGGFSTNSSLRLTNVQVTQAGSYSVVATNAFGSVTSAPATFNVIQPVVRRPVPGIVLTAQSNSLLNVEYRSSLMMTQDWESFPTFYITNSPQYFFDLTSPLPTQRFYRA